MPDGHRQLLDVRIGDAAEAWVAGGFSVDDGRAVIGNTTLSLVGGDRRGIVSMAVDGLAGDLDGLPLHPGSPTSVAGSHPNGITAIDHLVVMTPDCDRTTAAFEAHDIEARRVRTFEMSGALQRQTFFWLGDVICELVGEDGAHGDGPAMLWGLALTSPDLDATAEILGERCTPPKDAVQPGRRIATIRTRDLGISTAIAVMSPHPS